MRAECTAALLLARGQHWLRQQHQQETEKREVRSRTGSAKGKAVITLRVGGCRQMSVPMNFLRSFHWKTAFKA